MSETGSPAVPGRLRRLLKKMVGSDSQRILMAVGAICVALLVYSPPVETTKYTAVMTLFFTTALFLVTASYVDETRRIARTSENQIALLQAQISMDYTPNLLLSCEQSSGLEVGFRLVNLGRYPVWLLEATTTAPGGEAGIIRPSRGESPCRQYRLMPGDFVEVEPLPFITAEGADGSWSSSFATIHDAVLKVTFFYGSTAQQRHRREWRVHRAISSPDTSSVVEMDPDD